MLEFFPAIYFCIIQVYGTYPLHMVCSVIPSHAFWTTALFGCMESDNCAIKKLQTAFLIIGNFLLFSKILRNPPIPQDTYVGLKIVCGITLQG
jgi:hypothetical protein